MDASLQCSRDNYKTEEYSKRGAMKQGGVKGESLLESTTFSAKCILSYTNEY